MTGPVPEPPPASKGTLGTAVDTFRGLPRWAMFGVLAVGGLVGWYVYKAATSANTASSTWEQKARDLLTSRGYDSVDIESALSHYQGGGQMSSQDLALIAEVIRAIGTPDMPTTSADVTNPSPVIPSGGVSNNTITGTDQSITNAGGVIVSDPGIAGYWYVISLGYGWSSSLRGISQQFYGDTNQATMLLQLNPGTTSSEYARIQPGVRIRVPRSLTV